MARGEKFVDKYGVETYQVYKGSDEALKIPGPDHPLYDPTAPTTFDPVRVAAIDRDGRMTTPVEIFTDPDAGILWVLDGRGRKLDVQEVNRRRAKEGRDLVKLLIVPFVGDEKAAVARVREKNYHRRSPTPSGMALDLLALRNKGYEWAACANILHHTTPDPEQWGRKLLPLAYCVEEVRIAIDTEEIPRGKAAKFGGTAPDGSKALGKKEQLALLAELRAAANAGPAKGGASTITTKQRERVHAALTNGASEKLKGADKLVAEVVAATIARLGGDSKALHEWPLVDAAVSEALKPLPKGPKAMKPKKEKKAKKSELAKLLAQGTPKSAS